MHQVMPSNRCLSLAFVLTLLAGTVALASEAKAFATAPAPGDVTVYPVSQTGTGPSLNGTPSIASGSDNNLWVGIGDTIFRVTQAGVVTPFPLPAHHFDVMDILAGADGNLWFTNVWTTEENVTAGLSIGKITTAGQITEYDYTYDPDTGHAFAICCAKLANGPNGKIWFTNNSAVAKLDPASPQSPTWFDLPIAGGLHEPVDLAAGPDAHIWVGSRIGTYCNDRSAITEITNLTTGAATDYQIVESCRQPRALVSGPDGAIWYANSLGLSRVSVAGVQKNYSKDGEVGFGTPMDITVGSDGNLWTASGDYLERVTPLGSGTRFPVPAEVDPNSLTLGADNNLWFTSMTFATDPDTQEFTGYLKIGKMISPAPYTTMAYLDDDPHGYIFGDYADHEWDCEGNTCRYQYNLGETAHLTAEADQGYVFDGWTGECAGTVGTTCDLVMNGPHSVGADFRAANPTTLTVKKTGSGAAAGSFFGLGNCNAPCTKNLHEGDAYDVTADYIPSEVTLTWTGCDSVTTSGTRCEFVMTTDRTVTANFAPSVIPDAKIKTLSENEYTGNDIYNLNGKHQSALADVDRGSYTTFAIQVQNDSAYASPFILKGPGRVKGLTVDYIRGNTGVTDQVTGGGLYTKTLQPGASASFTVKVRAPKHGVDPGTVARILMTFANTYTDGIAKDAVKAVVTVQ